MPNVKLNDMNKYIIPNLPTVLECSRITIYNRNYCRVKMLICQTCLAPNYVKASFFCVLVILYELGSQERVTSTYLEQIPIATSQYPTGFDMSHQYYLTHYMISIIDTTYSKQLRSLLVPLYEIKHAQDLIPAGEPTPQCIKRPQIKHVINEITSKESLLIR